MSSECWIVDYLVTGQVIRKMPTRGRRRAAEIFLTCDDNIYKDSARILAPQDRSNALPFTADLHRSENTINPDLILAKLSA